MHCNAWHAVKATLPENTTWDDIDTAYYERCGVKLIWDYEDKNMRSSYSFLEFKDQEHFVLYLLEWG